MNTENSGNYGACTARQIQKHKMFGSTFSADIHRSPLYKDIGEKLLIEEEPSASEGYAWEFLNEPTP